MGDFIIAVLVVSVLWILWDLLKLLVREREKGEPATEFVNGPGKEMIGKIADSFQDLANTFHSMPCQKERLSQGDVKEIFHEVQDRICSQCAMCSNCWEKEHYNTYRRVYDILSAIEEEGEEISADKQVEFIEYCIHGRTFLEEMVQVFSRAKLNLLWSNRLLENRSAVAEQLHETADIVRKISDNVYDVKNVDEDFREKVKMRLRLRFVVVKDLWVLPQDQDRQQIFMTMRSMKGRCVSTKEIGIVLSEICKSPMVPAKDSRMMINREYSTVLFVSDTKFSVLNGVARVTRDGEMISGDNFGFLSRDNGQMIMSLSDGMGSGIGACKESEKVIELLEQFLDAGFNKETAVRMINSALVLQGGMQMFSTIDLCAIDLYNGSCELMKIGASTTFFKRNNWVEAVTSTSLPVGMLQTVDFDCTSKKLTSGDFIIMISDGVLDALPPKNAEEVMKELIMEIQTTNAREFAKALLERVLIYQNCRAMDDMTVLVGGVWKK